MVRHWGWAPVLLSLLLSRLFRDDIALAVYAARSVRKAGETGSHVDLSLPALMPAPVRDSPAPDDKTTKGESGTRERPPVSPAAGMRTESARKRCIASHNWNNLPSSAVSSLDFQAANNIRVQDIIQLIINNGRWRFGLSPSGLGCRYWM